MSAKGICISTHACTRGNSHQSHIGVPADFSPLEWIAWKQVTDERMDTQSYKHTLTARRELQGLWCPQVGLMTRSTSGTTDGPSLSHMRASVSLVTMTLYYLLVHAVQHIYAYPCTMVTPETTLCSCSRLLFCVNGKKNEPRSQIASRCSL